MTTTFSTEVPALVPVDDYDGFYQAIIDLYARNGVVATPTYEGYLATPVGHYHKATYHLEGTDQELVEQLAKEIKFGAESVLSYDE